MEFRHILGYPRFQFPRLDVGNPADRHRAIRVEVRGDDRDLHGLLVWRRSWYICFYMTFGYPDSTANLNETEKPTYQIL